MLGRCLIVRFSSIGDIVLTTSLLEYLGDVFPETELHFLTLAEYQSLLEGNPRVSRVIGISRDTSLTTLRHLAGTLNDYDLYVDLHNSLRSKYLRHFLKGERWLVYRKQRLNRLLLFFLHFDRFSSHQEITSEYIGMLNEQEPPENPPAPRIYISQQECDRARLFLRERGVRGDYAVFVPGAAWKTKIWLDTSYVKVINSISDEEGLSVVLLGGKRDIICEVISRGAPMAANLRGATELRSSLAILSCATIVLGGDTGLIHAAQALGVPVLLIKGPTSWQTGAKVRSGRAAEIALDIWCRPCSKNGSRPCYRRERFCMTGITPDRVLASMRNILGEA